MVAALVFCLTYVAIAAGRFPLLSVDRPAAALLGAVLMVAVGALTPDEARAAVDGDTIALLLGMMILTAYLTEAAFFRWASWHLLTRVHRPRLLLAVVVVVAGGLSAFLVNDTVCLMMTPLVLRLVDDAELPPLPYLLAVAFGSNAGSVATPTGNPQNMMIGTHSGIGYAAFTAALGVPAIVSVGLVAALLVVMFRRRLPARTLPPTHVPPPDVDRPLLVRALVVTALVVIGFLAGLSLSWTALGGAAVLMAIAGRPPREGLARVDWPLLLFFAGLFVVTEGVSRTGLTLAAWDHLAPLLGTDVTQQMLGWSAFAVLGSQLVSNVPFVMIAADWIPHLADPTLAWLVTALVTTLAGNLTVVGSVANLIVLELARDRVRVGFWTFFGYGSVVTVATLAAGLTLLLAEAHLGLIAH